MSWTDKYIQKGNASVNKKDKQFDKTKQVRNDEKDLQRKTIKYDETNSDFDILFKQIPKEK